MSKLDYRKKVKELHEQVKSLMIDTKNRKNSFTLCLKDVEEESLEYGHFYLQMLHYIREFSHSINYVVDASYEHIFNNHRGINDEQYKELEYLCEHLEDIFRDVKKAVSKQDFENIRINIKETMALNDKKKFYENIFVQENSNYWIALAIFKAIKLNESNMGIQIQEILYCT